MTETELSKAMGVPVKELPIKKKDFVVLSCHEENSSAKVLPISLIGMPCEIAQGVRKMRLYHEAQVEGVEHLLLRENQLAEEAPANWLDFATNKHVESRPTSLHLQQKHNLTLWSTLQETADGILQGRSEEEEEPEEAEAAEADDDRFFSDDNGPAPVAMPVAGLGSFGSSKVEEASAKKSAAAKKLKRKKQEAEEPQQEEEATEILEIGGSGDTAEIGDDSDMALVSAKHIELGYPASDCLGNLKIEKFFAGKAGGGKLGNVLNGVSTSFSIC